MRQLLRPWKTAVERGVAAAQAEAAASTTEVGEILATHATGAGPTHFSRQIPAALERDFVTWRSPTYVQPMTDGVADELAAVLTGRIRPAALDHDALVRLFTRTALCNCVRGDDARGVYICDFTADDLHLLVTTYIHQFGFDLDGAPSSFFAVDRDGRRYTPADPEWETVLCHVVAQFTIWPPLASHNWIHFNFPCSVAAAHYHTLRGTDTNLERLVAPHIRFTNRINMQALYVQKSVMHGPSWKNALVPWYGLPIYGEQFREGVASNTARHYGAGDHFMLPDRLDTRVPYFAFLSAYFEVVDRFVAACVPHLEDDAWDTFSARIARTVPGWADVDRRRALAVFIWQVGVYHCTDHLSYAREALKYGFCRTRGGISTPMTLQDVRRWDRFQTRNLIKIFVLCNENPRLDQRLEHVEAYGFEAGSPLYQAAQTFREELRIVDRRLAAEGIQILPLSSLIQSICF